MGITDKKIIYLKYIRKSTESDDQQVLSIESQNSELTKLAQREKLEFADLPPESKSAKMPGERPVFKEMLKQIRKSDGMGILSWHPDRLSRNALDAAELIHLMDIGKLLEIRTPSSVFINTPNDKFLLSMLCSAAKLENDNKGINVKRGLKTKAENGWYPTVAPIGYLNDRPNDKGKREIKVDPERFDLVRKMFDLMLSGAYTPPQILTIVTDKWGLRMRNGHPICRSSIYRIFTDPFYMGIFEYPQGSGTWYTGKHKPMITANEFDTIQIRLGRKGKPRPQKYFFPFTGMVTCGECGSTIVADKKCHIICSECRFKFSGKTATICPRCHTAVEDMKNPKIRTYVYYGCTHKKNPACSQRGWLRAEDLRQQAVDVLESIEIPEVFHRWAMKRLRRHNRQETEARNGMLSDLKRRMEECNKKISGIIDMRAAGELNAEEFVARKGDLVKEKLRVEELMNDNFHNVDKWLEAAERIFDFARDARKSFETGDTDTMRRIMSALGSNLALKNKSLTVKMEKPLEIMEKISSGVKKIPGALEPDNSPENIEKIERMYAESPVILPGVDSNHQPCD